MMTGKGTAKKLEQLAPKALSLTITITQSYLEQTPGAKLRNGHLSV